jgi:hypothetical protein
MAVDDTVAALELTGVAASSDPLTRRAEQLLTVLRRVIPYESARPVLSDPDRTIRACGPSPARISPRLHLRLPQPRDR